MEETRIERREHNVLKLKSRVSAQRPMFVAVREPQG